MNTITDGNISISTDNESQVDISRGKHLTMLEKVFFKNIQFEGFEIEEKDEESISVSGDYEDYEEYFLEEEFDTNRLRRPEPRKENAKRFKKNQHKEYQNEKRLEMEQKLTDLITFGEPEEIVIDTAEHLGLINLFKLANIDLKLVDRPSKFSTKKAKTSADTENFLMDLRKKNQTTGYGQHVIMYPGKGTKIQVLDADKALSQLVLVIEEPERVLKVEREVYRHKLGKYIKVTNTIKNNPEQRYFLIGKDEGHLFVAQIREMVLTVQQAHKSLLPSKLKGVNKSKYRRQGEWFFVPIKWDSPSFQREDFGMRSGTGRPHMAEYFHQSRMNYSYGYAKGKISHPEHKTINLTQWNLVYVNNESRANVPRGLTWID
jgi:hypothetical protein